MYTWFLSIFIVFCRCSHYVLYANRAAALLKRAFRGDVYAALRDCISALDLNSSYVKAHLRLGIDNYSSLVASKNLDM